MTALDDPHDVGKRLEPFRKNEKLEDYFVRLNEHLQAFDQSEVSSGEAFPLIYVIGLPRSGTTLMSQLISRHLPVGYINNLIARFWRNPVVGIRLSQAVLESNVREKIELASTHGVTAEPWGPHEFGYFWRHWLRLDEAPNHNLSKPHLDGLDHAGLAMTLNRMAAAFGAPVVFKNIICGLQAEFLTKICPNSLFVLIERNPQAVAASLLRARKQRYGDESVWWSLKPSTFDEVRLIPEAQAQIERQVADGSSDFHAELIKSGVNFVRTTYEDLCRDPIKSVQMVADASAGLGYPLALRESPRPIIKATLEQPAPFTDGFEG